MLVPQINFVDSKLPAKGTLVLLAAGEKKTGSSLRKLDKESEGQISKALSLTSFKGKGSDVVDLILPTNLPYNRVKIVGIGETVSEDEADWQALGGRLFQQIKDDPDGVTLMGEDLGKDFKLSAACLAQMAYGFQLRSYGFKKYKSSSGRGGAENGDKPSKGASLSAPMKALDIACSKPSDAKQAFARLEAVRAGIFLARDLVNEPANILGPVEFAMRVRALEEVGVQVNILDENEMAEKNMTALLAVGQGSERPSRLAVMQWLGAENAKDKPLAIVGKGVCFDSGGISIKPSQGMEDMKGDMGGAACVTGLMRALAERKAAVNVVGVIGLVENMPDGKAQRPGDVINSMSGQTIEVINTDAEGRLVLADALTYTMETFKPKLMIDLATLTGAILVALGKEHAGLFSNNDRLANRLLKAGISSGETLWRLPLGKTYDKMIDSQIADMKNIGGRFAGSITAAQFLQRYVGNTPWAHIDVAGTAMGSPKTDINQSWGSGYGVALLDAFIAANYE